MEEKIINLRGHHLRILHSYALLKNEHSIQYKDQRVIQTAINDGHSRKMGQNIVKVMKKILNENVKIQLTDSLDDICTLCNNKKLKKCNSFILYDTSATADDRGVLYYYELQKRVYNSRTLLKKLLQKRIY